MNNIVILGNSYASVCLVDAIRTKDKETAITIISPEGFLPYDQDLFLGRIQEKLKLQECFVQPEQYFKDQNVNCVTDQKITRININRKKIHTEEKQIFDFDYLIITNPIDYKIKEIKGAQKEGVFGFNSLNDVDQIAKFLPLSETVVAQLESYWGFKHILPICDKEKDFTIVTPHSKLLIGSLGEDASEWLKNLLNSKGVTVLEDTSINEFLGDSDIKAVRLDTTKVLASQITLYESQSADFKLLQDSGIVFDEKIVVNEFYQSSVDYVFAIAQAAQESNQGYLSHEELERQSYIVAAKLTGEEGPAGNFIASTHFEYGDLTFTYIGQTKLGNDIEIKSVFNEEKIQLKRFFFKNDVLIGAVLINGRSHLDQIKLLISEKRNMADVGDIYQIDGQVAQQQEILSAVQSEEAIKSSDVVESHNDTIIGE